MAILKLSRGVALALALGLGLLAGPLTRVYAQETDETHVKAAFLFNFAKFAEWPAATFKSPSDPFRYCVVGSPATARVLTEITAGKTVDGHPLLIQPLPEGTVSPSCQILFVSGSAMAKTRILLGDLKGKSVLTVGETPGFTAGYGIVNFIVEDGRVRFEINPQAAEQAHLQLSSRLLSLARIVGTR